MTKKHVKLHKKITTHAKRVVVPHAKNQYRPHLVRWTGISIVIAAAFLLQGAYNVSRSGSVLGQGSDVSSEQLLSLTNRERKTRGVPALTLDQHLAVGATMKANDMFLHQYWAHNSPSGKTPWTWFHKADYSYDYAGENLAKNFATSSGVMSAWMQSPEHKENILDAHYTNVGFAVVPGKLDSTETMLVVAFYGTPKSAAPVATTASDNSGGTFAASGENTSPISRLGVGLQSLNPAIIGSIALLSLVIITALIVHAYRQKLPKRLRESWYRHHGIYKAAGMISMIIIVVALYGGGQI